MTNQTVSFNGGNIIISEKTISFKGRGQRSQTMDRNLIGAINSEEYTYLRLQVMQYGFRFGFGGIVLSIIGFVLLILKDINFIFWIGVTSAGFGGFLVFGYLIEGLFGFNFTTRLCENIFGEKGYIITIQNNSGGDHLEFVVDLNELNQAKDLIKYRKEKLTKSILKIDELKALLELKNLGILTEEEYDFKKNQFLNN